MKNIAFVKPGNDRFSLWYGNLNSRTLICKANKLHTLPIWCSWCVLLCKVLCLLWLPIFCSVSFAWARLAKFIVTKLFRKVKTLKNIKKKNMINFKILNDEDYNNPSKLSELTDAIKISNGTATGPNEIHYQMLKHLPENALVTILPIFSDIWKTGKFPESWRLDTIIPIPKPGKNPAEPTNYRPIALTSCLCKTLERMINKRLVWYLESNNLITPIQSGFRSERSTNDHLIRLETFIRDAFVNREHVVAVFWLGKGVWYYLEIWYIKGFTWYRS